MIYYNHQAPHSIGGGSAAASRIELNEPKDEIWRATNHLLHAKQFYSVSQFRSPNFNDLAPGATGIKCGGGESKNVSQKADDISNQADGISQGR